MWLISLLRVFLSLSLQTVQFPTSIWCVETMVLLRLIFVCNCNNFPSVLPYFLSYLVPVLHWSDHCPCWRLKGSSVWKSLGPTECWDSPWWGPASWWLKLETLSLQRRKKEAWKFYSFKLRPYMQDCLLPTPTQQTSFLSFMIKHKFDVNKYTDCTWS